MPAVNLPDDLREQLENSESGTINDADGYGVSRYRTSDARADIYIGLRLDGFRLYQNISSVHPEIKMQFSLEPVVPCQLLTFNPNYGNTVHIKVFVSCALLCLK